MLQIMYWYHVKRGESFQKRDLSWCYHILIYSVYSVLAKWKTLRYVLKVSLQHYQDRVSRLLYTAWYKVLKRLLMWLILTVNNRNQNIVTPFKKIPWSSAWETGELQRIKRNVIFTAGQTRAVKSIVFEWYIDSYLNKI